MMKKITTIYTVAALLAALAVGAAPANAALQAVGPTNAVTTIPAYYEDLSGLALAPCLDQSALGFCVLPPQFDPLATAIPQPITTTGPINDTNFPDEIFYYLADTQMLVGPTLTSKATLRLALEAAFAPTLPPPAPAVGPGNGATFLRINLKKMSGLTPLSTYTVTHPYGTFQFSTDALGDTVLGQAGQAFRIEDPFAGAIPGIFDALLPATTTHIGPFLVSAAVPGGPAAPVTDPVTGKKYIGNPVFTTAVTGSPLGTNVFRIDGPDIGGVGVNTIETTLFNLAGKIVGFILTPATVPDFGVWKLAAASTPKTITVQNLSGSPVVPVMTATVPNSNPVVPSPDFSIAASAVTPCGATLAGGASCNFDVVFNPATDGVKNATISVSDGTTVLGVPTPGIPPVQTTVTGSGDGIAPAAAITGIIRMTQTTGQAISGTVSDASGISAVQVSVNGGAPQTAIVANGAWSFNVAGLNPNAVNTIAVTASDTAQLAPGNQTTVSDTITVDTVAPAVAIDAVPATTVVSTQAITGTTTDLNAVSSVSVTVNGSLQGLATVTGGTWSFTASNLTPNVASTITATAADPAGNQATSAAASITFTVTVDGDINIDSQVNISDALLTLRAAVGLGTPTNEQKAHGDCAPLGAPNGTLDIADALLILRKVVGLIVF